MNSAAEIAIGFERFFIDHLCIVKQFEPTFRFGTLFSCNFKFGKHIGKALRILRLGNICEHARRGFTELKNGVGIAVYGFAEQLALCGKLFGIFK